MFNATDTARGRDAGAKRGTESLPSLSKLLFSFTPHPRCLLRSYGSQGLGATVCPSCASYGRSRNFGVRISRGQLAESLCNTRLSVFAAVAPGTLQPATLLMQNLHSRNRAWQRVRQRGADPQLAGFWGVKTLSVAARFAEFREYSGQLHEIPIAREILTPEVWKR